MRREPVEFPWQAVVFPPKPVATPWLTREKNMGCGGPQPTSISEVSVSLLTLPLKFGTRGRCPVLTLQKQAPSCASSRVV